MGRSVLIVDDEVLVRIGIRHSLEWEKNGFFIAGEASDGDECLEQVKKLTPDVIILDINMPKINGIEVLKKLKEWKYRGKIIVLTCYEELEYARSAMKYGASDYVLKTTIHEDGLLNALKELEFDREAAERRNMALPADRIREENMIKLLEGYPVSLEDFVIKPNHIFCISVKIRHLHEVLKRYEGKNPDFFYTSLQSMVRQVLTGQKECVFFPYKPDLIVIFFSFSFIPGTQECFLKIRQIADHLSAVLREYMALDTWIGVSTPKYKIELLLQAYQESILAIEESFIFPEKQIFYYEKENTEKMEVIFEQMEKGMEESVIDRAYDIVWEKSAEYFEAIRKNKRTDMHKRRKFLVNLMQLIRSLERESGNTENEIEKAENLDELETVIYQILNRYIEKSDSGESNYLIKKARGYLTEHFNKSVSLSDLADYMELSESYTSRLFNKVMGVNISAYVNELRIEQAKKLLLQTNKKIYEIASEVGYTSTTSFHIAFKKGTGVTPVEFRNKNF